MACSTMPSQWASSRFDEAMVLVNAIARERGEEEPSPGCLFSGFCKARQQPTILAASVMLISLSLDARCACKAAPTRRSDMARTTTL